MRRVWLVVVLIAVVTGSEDFRRQMILFLGNFHKIDINPDLKLTSDSR